MSRYGYKVDVHYIIKNCEYFHGLLSLLLSFCYAQECYRNYRNVPPLDINSLLLLGVLVITLCFARSVSPLGQIIIGTVGVSRQS